jgi:hypothetical protein
MQMNKRLTAVLLLVGLLLGAILPDIVLFGRPDIATADSAAAQTDESRRSNDDEGEPEDEDDGNGTENEGDNGGSGDDDEEEEDDEETEEPYTVDIDPADFITVIDNPYLPLLPGTTRIYEGETEDGLERIEVTVLNETKTVMGVTTTVVRDTVRLDGEIIEDTFDWFAQDKEGNVWYFGEQVDNYENGVLKDHAGSWEAGVDGALPGIVMHADPLAEIGEPYRQEYYPGEAEDMAKVLGLVESVTVPFSTFEDVLQTKDWTPLEPGIFEHKFYAEGIGVIKEVKLDSGETIELIEVIPG